MLGAGTPGVPFPGRTSGACGGLVRKYVYFRCLMLRGSTNWVFRAEERAVQRP